MKLHIGCGNNLLPDYINMDSSNIHFDIPDGIEYKHGDILNLHRLFTANSLNEIYSEYLFEHLSPSEIISALYKCWLVLEPRGTLEFIVPDIEAIVKYYHDQNRFEDFYSLEIMGYEILNWGGDETPHKSVWSESIGIKYLTFEGLFDISGIRKAAGKRGTDIEFKSRAIK